MFLYQNTTSIATKIAHNLTQGSGDPQIIQLFGKTELDRDPHVHRTARRSPSCPVGREIRCVSGPSTTVHKDVQ